MNLRGQSGYASSRLTLNAFSISFGLETYRQADSHNTVFNCFLHRPVRLELHIHSVGGSI